MHFTTKFTNKERNYDDKASLWAEKQMEKIKPKSLMNTKEDFTTPVTKQEYRKMLLRHQKNATSYEDKQVLEKELKNTHNLSNNGRRKY